MMDKKKISLQIFAGGYLEEAPSFERVRAVLEPLLQQITVERLIVGWSIKSDLYLKIIDFVKPYGCEVFLWLPVLSETGLLKPVKRLIDDEGKEVTSFQLKDGENFEFYCPNQLENFEGFLEIYDEYFSKIPFDGVFLDKIRYGSFSNGKSGVFNCFCPQCRLDYEKEGISAEELVREMKKIRLGKESYQHSPLGIKKYEHGKYLFENPIWEKFFSYKQKKISQYLKNIIEEMRSRGLKVGLDTFSPFTAYFSGQDVAELAKMADFVKPMMYRITKAPAGLLWESEQLLQETLIGSENEKFYELLEINYESDTPFDREFVKKELIMLADEGACLYPGIEVNRIADIAETTPDYIQENVEMLSELPVKGMVLAWDILSAPIENLEKIISLFRK